MLENREWLTMTEAAKSLGVSRQRFHQIVGEEKIETFDLHPRLKLISRLLVEKLIKKRNSQHIA